MKKEKYLIIGDSNSVHIYNYVKNILIPNNYEVHLLTLSILPIKDMYYKFYLENNVIIHSVNKNNSTTLNLTKKNVFKRTIFFFKKILLITELPKIDICHVHSVYKTSLIMVKYFRYKFNKILLSFWGGDIEDTNSYVIKLRKNVFEKADKITVTVEKTKIEFREIYGVDYDSKLAVCRFATEGIEHIKEMSKIYNTTQCKEILGFNKDKIIITCGYSAYAAQHQDICLEQINLLGKDLKEKIQVIVPMQYGRFDQKYICRVKEISKKCDYDIKIIEEYYSGEKSSMLAMATDIYVHVRDTDAFSNALKEHVYSGNVVIKGKWLKYIELDERKADIISINKLSKLNEVIKELLESNIDFSNKKTFDPLYDLYSKKSTYQQWIDILENL